MKDMWKSILERVGARVIFLGAAVVVLAIASSFGLSQADVMELFNTLINPIGVETE